MWCDCRVCCKECCLSWGCGKGCAKCCASGCSKCCACHCCTTWCSCLTSATCTLPILAYSCGGVVLGVACVACCLGYSRMNGVQRERPPARAASSHVENALQNPIPDTGTRTLAVTVPNTCRAGDTIEVAATDGTRLRIRIPQGALAGQVIHTSYSAPEPGYTDEPVMAVPIAEPLGEGAMMGPSFGSDGFPAAYDETVSVQPAPSAPPPAARIYVEMRGW
mmetsp:Transcript_15686/g.28193  ORF Transcript_15686/g.28193 Transcript_15686/m.28193 type:complete len:221 (+) Transcript_15686:382-1044(+)